MNKLFGTSKPKPKPEPANNINAPTLTETSQKVVYIASQYISNSLLLYTLVGPKRQGHPGKDR